MKTDRFIVWEDGIIEHHVEIDGAREARFADMSLNDLQHFREMSKGPGIFGFGNLPINLVLFVLKNPAGEVILEFRGSLRNYKWHEKQPVGV